MTVRRAYILGPILAAAAIAVAALPSPASAAGTLRLCGQIGFTPNSDDGAFKIRARGVGCTTARAVARRSRGRGPVGTPGRRYTYRTQGFVCRGTEIEDGLPVVNYRCTREGATVTFQKG